MYIYMYIYMPRTELYMQETGNNFFLEVEKQEENH